MTKFGGDRSCNSGHHPALGAEHADENAARRIQEANDAAAAQHARREADAVSVLIDAAVAIVDPVIARLEEERDRFQGAPNPASLLTVGEHGMGRAHADLEQLRQAAASHPRIAIALNLLIDTLKPAGTVYTRVAAELAGRADAIRHSIAAARDALAALNQHPT